MATIGAIMTPSESDAFLDGIDAGFQREGFGLWCADLHGEALGFAGLSRPSWRDGVEIGWRIKSECWGQGYATEAAAAVLDHAFESLGLDDVISFTAATNVASRRVMEKIGLGYDPEGDFDHPNVKPGSSPRAHVLYRLSASERA